jgi:dTDP-4-dehydrorhamnose reductase
MKGLILVTGSKGLVGSRFIELSPRKNFLHLPTEVELDITDTKDIKEIIKNYNFTSIINFAAFTDVTKSEEERDNKDGLCWQVNVEGVKNLVDSINPNKIHFIQISTDMVFSGEESNPGPYNEYEEAEKDSTKLTWYGYTKAEAERYIIEHLGDKATIVRICNPVRASFPDKLDYARKPLKLFDEGKLYPLFSDQTVSITYIDEVAYALEKIVSLNVTGVLHVSSPDTTTPFEFVSYLIEKARGKSGVVQSTRIDKYIQTNTSFRYPKKGGLSILKTKQKLEVDFSSWRNIVDQLVSQGLGLN